MAQSGKKFSRETESYVNEELIGILQPEIVAPILDALDDVTSANKELLDIISADAGYETENTGAEPPQKSPVPLEEAFDSLYITAKTRGYVTEDEILNIGSSSYDVARLTEKLLDHNVIIREEKIINETEYDASKTDYDRLYKRIIQDFPELKSFIQYVSKIQPPQKNEWQRLLPQVKSENKWAVKRIFEMYLRVVIKMAWYYHRNYDLSFEDAIQNGAAGLLYAIYRFDITEYTSFPGFIARPIQGYITRYCDIPNYSLFVLPVTVKADLFKIYNIFSNHQCPECMSKKRKNECETLKDEIMVKLGCSLPEATEYINLLTEHENEIFDLVDENAETVFDIHAKKELKSIVDDIVSTIPEQERLVLIKRYGLEDGESKTLDKVGHELGLTRERVRQIEQKALNLLKHPSRVRRLALFKFGKLSVRSIEDDKPSNTAKCTNKVTRTDCGWTSKDLKKLRKLVDRRLSATSIGKKLNKSKSAVIGKLYRLGWKFKE